MNNVTSVHRITGLALLLILVVGSLFADRIELLNGDVITGTIVSVDAERVVIEADYGVLEVDRAAVVSGFFGRPAYETDSGLILHLPLNGDATDATGNYQVTNNGMRFVADPTGLPQAAARSDGTGTFLSVPSDDTMGQLVQLSITFDLKIEELTGTHYIISKWGRADGETADGKFTVQSSGGGITMFLVDPQGTYHSIAANGVLTANQWYSICLTFAGGRSQIFVNGEEAATSRFGFSGLFADSSPLLVMTAEAQSADVYGYYNTIGSIDDLRLYDRSLSPDEIAALVHGSPIE